MCKNEEGENERMNAALPKVNYVKSSFTNILILLEKNDTT